MRTVTKTIYKYGELTPEAQKKAVDNLRNSLGSVNSEWDSDDYRETLEKIEEVFGIDVNRWCVGYPGTHFSFDFNIGVSTTNLCRYLNNTVLSRVGYFKYYSGPFHPDRTCIHKYSKVVLDKYGYSCCLTGTYSDWAVDDALNHMWESVRKKLTPREFVSEMLDNFFKRWEEDVDYCYTDEFIAEEIENNEYEFLEDGTKY